MKLDATIAPARRPAPRDAVRTVAIVGAGLSIAIGVVALAGWSLGLPTLRQFFTVRSAMQPMTALCAMATGVAIAQADRTIAGWRWSQVLIALVMLAAAQTLIAYGLNIDVGIDHLFFAASVDSQPVTYPHPGRMAAPTAAAYLTIGIALTLVHVRGEIAGLLLSACATSVLLLVTVALLGYFYMVAPLTGILGFTQVSIPTAIALGGASLGVLALRPDDGWVRLLIGSSVGATAARWLLPVAVIVPVTVAALALRGSEVGLYPADFRLAFTTAVTVVLLVALALWGAWQLDGLVAARRAAETLRESEATLRAFFETEGLFASIIERHGDEARFLTANAAFSALWGRNDVTGQRLDAVQPEAVARATVARLKTIEASSAAASLEEVLETDAGTRWFAVTISPVAGGPGDLPRFATAAFEITGRKQAEAHQTLLLQELNHRVKNTLAVVQSLAQQSFRGDLADPAAKAAFEARLAAVASAHHLLVHQNWTSASMRALTTEVAGPGCGADRDRIDMDGPDIALPPRAAVSFALALHELCTNAVKYGALSNDVGRVAIRWATDATRPGRLCLIWSESGGPPVGERTAKGFGSRLIERALAAELGGPVRMDFRSTGLVCTVEADLLALT